METNKAQNNPNQETSTEESAKEKHGRVKGDISSNTFCLAVRQYSSSQDEQVQVLLNSEDDTEKFTDILRLGLAFQQAESILAHHTKDSVKELKKAANKYKRGEVTSTAAKRVPTKTINPETLEVLAKHGFTLEKLNSLPPKERQKVLNGARATLYFEKLKTSAEESSNQGE